MASGKSHHETGRKLRPLRSFSCDVYSGYSNIALRRAMKPSPGRYRFRLYEAKAQNVLPTMSHKVMICDQGSNNRQLIESFEKVTCDRPFITVNHNPVFVTSHMTRLLKNIRNNLMKQGFIVNG